MSKDGNNKCSDFITILIYPNYHDNNLKKNKFEGISKLINKFSSKYKCIFYQNNLPLKETLSNNNVQLILCNYYSDIFDKISQPIIICDRMDSACINGKNYKALCMKDNVIALIKEYGFIDKKLNYYNWISNRYHYTLIDKTNSKKSTEKNLKINLSKLKICSWNLFQYSFVCNNSMSYMSNITTRDKDIDIFYVCHSHKESDTLYMHRFKIFETIKEIIKKNKFTNTIGMDINMRKRDYMDTIKRSKICICPYGLGGRIALDQFALLAGSIVIKPDMKYITCDPMIYTNEYMEFFNDCSELEHIIKKIIENYDTYYKKLSEIRREKVLKFDEKYYANKFNNTLDECLKMK